MTAKKVSVQFLDGGSAANCLSQVVLAYTECKKVTEEEKTKRREISAWEKTTIAQIKAQRDVLIDYLESSFDERAKNFQLLFEKVDQAILKGDNNQLAVALNSITEIAKSSPFKDLANITSVKAALDDPDHEWTF